MTTPTIRPAVESDLAAINALYNREVLEGVATWELDEWPAERRAAWFHARDAEEPVLVAECDGRLAGFAYLTRYRGRRGYRFTRENTVFVDPDFQRQGVGRLLLGAIIEAARALGLRTILAFIDADNAGSIALHRAFGYEQIGLEAETGYKFEAWRSALELQLMLDRPLVSAPRPGLASRTGASPRPALLSTLFSRASPVHAQLPRMPWQSRSASPVSRSITPRTWCWTTSR